MDARSGRVVLLSHCLLNQNVRYLGGAALPGMVPAAVQRFIDEGVGLYQMPCPEQAAWGGVAKRVVVGFYGCERTWAYRLRGLLLPLFLAWTRWVYRRIARRVARHVRDYVRSGFEVVGVIGVGDSPSCGVRHTLDLRRSLPVVAALDPDTVDAPSFRARAVRACIVDGQGLFVAALRRELAKRGISVTFEEHVPDGA